MKIKKAGYLLVIRFVLVDNLSEGRCMERQGLDPPDCHWLEHALAPDLAKHAIGGAVGGALHLAFGVGVLVRTDPHVQQVPLLVSCYCCCGFGCCCCTSGGRRARQRRGAAAPKDRAPAESVRAEAWLRCGRCAVAERADVLIRQRAGHVVVVLVPADDAAVGLEAKDGAPVWARRPFHLRVVVRLHPRHHLDVLRFFDRQRRRVRAGDGIPLSFGLPKGDDGKQPHRFGSARRPGRYRKRWPVLVEPREVDAVEVHGSARQQRHGRIAVLHVGDPLSSCAKLGAVRVGCHERRLEHLLVLQPLRVVPLPMRRVESNRYPHHSQRARHLAHWPIACHELWLPVGHDDAAVGLARVLEPRQQVGRDALHGGPIRLPLLDHRRQLQLLLLLLLGGLRARLGRDDTD